MSWSWNHTESGIESSLPEQCKDDVNPWTGHTFGGSATEGHNFTNIGTQLANLFTFNKQINEQVVHVDGWPAKQWYYV